MDFMKIFGSFITEREARMAQRKFINQYVFGSGRRKNDQISLVRTDKDSDGSFFVGVKLKNAEGLDKYPSEIDGVNFKYTE